MTIALRILMGLAATATVALAADRFVQAGRLHALKGRVAACEALAKGGDRDPAAACTAEVGARIVEARRAAACEAALKAGDLYAIRATCSAEAKRVQQQAQSAAADAARLRAELIDATIRTDQAVARAEARATASAQRKAQNDTILSAAPRTGDGRVRCDAECLRGIAGASRAAPPR